LFRTEKALVPYLKSLEGDIFLSRGNTAQAKAAYSIALKEAPLTASALFGMGRIMILSHDQKRGALYLERALRIRPDLLEAHYLLGSLLEKSNPISAKKHLEIFTKLAATDPDFISEVEASRKILRASK
ncbi:MAG: tetratricopeptide repeat protein, partial [Bdellovibrionota bacterium]